CHRRRPGPAGRRSGFRAFRSRARQARSDFRGRPLSGLRHLLRSSADRTCGSPGPARSGGSVAVLFPQDQSDPADLVRRPGAVDRGAADVHVEPGRDAVAVRYRIDGFLQQERLVPATLRAALTTRMKIMAKLDIAERRLPQDGRIKTVVRGVEIDIRVSTLPTVFGESVVMRILDRTRVELDFTKLGIDGRTQECLQRLMALPNGIILVTGPTGSGKTTTL